MSPSNCPHADVATLRDAQLQDDEIQVMVLMATSGRCPLCHPERDDEYRREVVMARGRGWPRCDVMRGDGSIPQGTCVLPAGHGAMGYEPHYG